MRHPLASLPHPPRLLLTAYSLIAAALILAGCGNKKDPTNGPGNDASVYDSGLADYAVIPLDLTYVPACGNAILDPNEACDDGNKNDGDGCSSTCTIESGYLCPTPGSPCEMKPLYCGDGIVTPPETCDDGNSKPGDGCDGTCRIEANYKCVTPANGGPQVCTSTIVCGDGVIEGNEACDTGETSGTEGCAADCSAITPLYTCPTPGQACVKQKANTCPNSVVDSGETCDDGNSVSGDGCSSTCQIEPHYTCPTAGMKCIPWCGDNKLEMGETCDDGNTTSGDGCSAQCQTEPYYTCTAPPTTVCTSTIKCGDGLVQGKETCDDHNTVSGDGCSSTCTVEQGWTCPAQGVKCQAAACGDGVKAGLEQCDDGNTVSGDGCSSTCILEHGFYCTVSGNPQVDTCYPTHCGDGVKQGFEQCDDGNLIPFDGCSATCTIETHCTGGKCTSVCGDGLVFPDEGCDDGNVQNGDGCSSTCTVEDGFMCNTVVQSPPTSLQIPILYRDMLYYNTTFPPSTVVQGHPDFQHVNSSNTGLVQSTLGADGEPVYKSSGSGEIQDAYTFCWWYHETNATCPSAAQDMGIQTNPYDKLVYLDINGNPTTLTLTQTTSTSGVYTYASTRFFPIDGLGWNANAATTQTDLDKDNVARNFSFTSELHYPFTYTAANSTTTTGPNFTFEGDDDVWFFINGQLVVDLGGTHGPEDGSYMITTTNAATLGLVDGGMYSIDVFQAEAHTNGSNYTLSLANFTHAISQCKSICGDGKVVGLEQCDNGTAKNTGAYGGCNSDCTLAPYCGNDKVDQISAGPPATSEQCDDGKNQSTYGGKTQQCGPGCVYAPYCGDGVISDGEICDDGSLNGTSGHCSTNCTPSQSCGDGVINGAEQCDDGANNGVGTDPCLSGCTLRCGDGVVESGEDCDDGTTYNVGGYGKCTSACKFGPHCGDGVKNGNEQCDNGANNNGAYGGCTASCTLGPYCGDGVINGTEACDNGAQNQAAPYGPNKCTTTCVVGPYCGDGIVQKSNGETCDGTANCNSTCNGGIIL